MPFPPGLAWRTFPAVSVPAVVVDGLAGFLWFAQDSVAADIAEADAVVAGLQRGEAQAMFGFARRQGLSNDQADDVVQEVFARMLREQRRGVTIANPRSWAYQTLYRLAMDEHRFRRRVGVIVDALARRPGSQRRDPDERIAVWTEVDRLPLRQRQIIYLRYRADLSFDEIGRVLGITASAARSHTAQAVARLRGRLSDTPEAR